VKNEKPLQRIDRIFHTVTTTDDPIIRKLVKSEPKVSQFDSWFKVQYNFWLKVHWPHFPNCDHYRRNLLLANWSNQSHPIVEKLPESESKLASSILVPYVFIFISENDPWCFPWFYYTVKYRYRYTRARKVSYFFCWVRSNGSTQIFLLMFLYSILFKTWQFCL
jgi:Eukaryotic translation initiation factor 3 subunit 7 (eIF-3)